MHINAYNIIVIHYDMHNIRLRIRRRIKVTVDILSSHHRNNYIAFTYYLSLLLSLYYIIHYIYTLRFMTDRFTIYTRYKPINVPIVYNMYLLFCCSVRFRARINRWTVYNIHYIIIHYNYYCTPPSDDP